MSDSGHRRHRGRALVALALALLVAAPPAFAVGTVVVTAAAVGQPGSGYTKITVDWTSDAAGAVSGNAFGLPPGHIIQVKFIPDAAGTQPTDLYDATLIDSHSVDYLRGSGANLSNATAAGFIYSPPWYHDGVSTLDLVIANAGNAKGGTVIVLVGP